MQMFIISTEFIHVYKLLAVGTNLSSEKKWTNIKYIAWYTGYIGFTVSISVYGQIDVNIPSFVNLLYKDRKPAFGRLNITLGKLNIIFKEFL